MKATKTVNFSRIASGMYMGIDSTGVRWYVAGKRGEWTVGRQAAGISPLELHPTTFATQAAAGEWVDEQTLAAIAADLEIDQTIEVTADDEAAFEAEREAQALEAQAGADGAELDAAGAIAADQWTPQASSRREDLAETMDLRGRLNRYGLAGDNDAAGQRWDTRNAFRWDYRLAGSWYPDALDDATVDRALAR